MLKPLNKKIDIKNTDVKRHYELVLMFRSNILFSDVSSDLTSLMSFVTTQCKGNVIRSEYWGLRPLSYRIKGNVKAHYYFFSLECLPESIKHINAKIRPNENIIRHACLKSEFESVRYQSSESIMLKNLQQDVEKEMGELVWSESFVYKI